MAAKKKQAPLPVLNIGGAVRELRPQDRRPDGSVILQCHGGPYDRRQLRLYPPFNDPVVVADGVYRLAGPAQQGGADGLLFQREGVPSEKDVI
jgi:hypothetical protein